MSQPCECGCGQEVRRRYAKGHHGRIPDIERFQSKIRVDPDGCWVWTGKQSDGYGRMDRRQGGKQYARLTHRWAYEHFVGSIPEGWQIDHLCRNRACCNPEHLEPVTQAENLRRRPKPQPSLLLVLLATGYLKLVPSQQAS